MCTYKPTKTCLNIQLSCSLVFLFPITFAENDGNYECCNGEDGFQCNIQGWGKQTCMEFPLSVHHCCIFNLFDAHLALAQFISLYKAYVMKPFEILPPPHHGKMVKEARAWSKHAWDKCNHHSTR